MSGASHSYSQFAVMGKRRKTTRARPSLGPASILGSLPTKLQLSMLQTGLLSVGEQRNLIPRKPVELGAFSKFVELRRRYHVLLSAEWQLLTKTESHSTRHATKAANESKNQNRKVVPYDYNRVVLDPMENVADSDYVNASYIDVRSQMKFVKKKWAPSWQRASLPKFQRPQSILKPNAYIATQGPNEKTVNDMWRLLWQEDVACIIMLTKTFDFIKVMCAQYWPSQANHPEQYGEFEIVVKEEEYLANFIIRTFRVTKGGEHRNLLQFHYTEWPSHSVPFTSAILEFRRRIQQYLTSGTRSQGPILVHCSDGGERTGVFLAIDANLQSADEDGTFDVFGYVKKLKSARRGLVDTLEQYRFIYETLEENASCGVSWFHVSELSQKLKFKSTRHGITRQNEYQKEYEQICRMAPKFSIGDCAGGHRQENREKNRDVIVVPPDNYRPYLISFQGNDFTDYINAVFVDGYTRPKEYLVTEWPLKNTAADLWSLVYDYECNTVVILCNPEPSLLFPSFWPETSRTRKYGNVFTIEHVSNHHYPNIKTWIFKINKKVLSLTELMAGIKAETKTVQFFQLTCWPIGHKVPTSTNALVELMNMVDRWRQRTNYGPVVVVSNNGCSRAGVYCAASAAIEQVIQHDEVDVFQAVKTVRRHRPQLVDNMTEYKYCYDLVLHYVLHYLNKK